MEEFLQCCICCINYDDTIHVPRQLPCQHNLCSICLPYMVKKINNSEYIECPTCREKTHKSLHEIPKSLVLMQLVEATKGQDVQSSIRNSVSNNQPIRPSRPPPPLPPYPNPTPSYTNTNPFIDYEPPNASSSSSPNNSHTSYSTATSDKNNNFVSSSNNQTNPSSVSSAGWSYKNYLRGVFNEMDVNKDGSITANELQQALRMTQSTSEFSRKTVELLMSKYDTNGDREISFEEFHDLFLNLNEEFESFLYMDADDSGSIDINEFSSSINKKGYNFSNDFYLAIMNEIEKKTGHRGIRFDNYIRVAARFDFLCQSYRKTPYFQKESLERYLKKTFFQDFW